MVDLISSLSSAHTLSRSNDGRVKRHPFYFRSGDVSLGATLYDPGDPAGAVVVFSHGFGFHNNRAETGRIFVHTAEKLATYGIASLLFEYVGVATSEGEFEDGTPNARIENLHHAVDWAVAHDYTSVGVLGLSMGGAVAIHVCSERSDVRCLVTWSTVPSFDLSASSAHWHPHVHDPSRVERVSDRFFIDRPVRSVADAYCSLDIPKLQIQGDRDLAYFREEFEAFFPRAKEPKAHIVLPGADHVFLSRHDHEYVVQTSSAWLARHLVPSPP